MTFDHTGLPWVAPSPNLPTPASALVYPGQVIWEGTNISEGRGTTQPFEVFGAPFISPDRLLNAIDDRLLQGVVLRPVMFEPTANKWSGQSCRGFQIHVTDPSRYSSYALSLGLYQAVYRLYADQFSYKQPPYEYEFKRLPMDLILGDGQIRSQIESGRPISQIAAKWANGLSDYEKMIRKVRLY
jgi:uncharacterized protein YbbC (DUF1343 family)